MNELTRHIEILLLENDCVIVPDLGGFITHHQPAHYEEEEGIFLPPLRTIGFNPQLTMNDGVLTQAYMQTYHTDFPDAARKIAAEVNELKETLYGEGAVEMHGIGTLYYTIYNTYEFHPQLDGVLSPSLYALDAFSMTPLSAKVVDEPAIVAEEPNPVLPVKEKREFRLNPQWLGNAVAVAVAAVLFFILSVPVENTYVDKGNYASLGTDCLFDAIRSQSMATALMPTAEVAQQQKAAVKPIVVKTEKVASVSKEEVEVASVVKETPKAVEAPKAVKEIPAQAVAKKSYHIIVASLTTSADAKRMIQAYNRQGYKDASVLEGGGRFRISLCRYSNKTDAYKQLNDLKKADAFKGAWVLTSK